MPVSVTFYDAFVWCCVGLATGLGWGIGSNLGAAFVARLLR